MNERTFAMVANQLAIAEEADKYERVIYMMRNFLNGFPSEADDVNKATTVLKQAIYRKRLEAYMNAALWTLEPTDAQRSKLKEMAYKAFYRRGMSVAHLVEGSENNHPITWFQEEEADTRRWLDEVMLENHVGEKSET